MSHSSHLRMQNTLAALSAVFAAVRFAELSVEPVARWCALCAETVLRPEN